MLEERRSFGRLGAEDARVLPMLFAPAIRRCSLPRTAAALGPFAPLQELLELMFQLRKPPP